MTASSLPLGESPASISLAPAAPPESPAAAPEAPVSSPAPEAPGAAPEANEKEVAAAAARELAWDLAQEPYFDGVKLHPWSRERHMLAVRLKAMDMPSPSLSELGRIQAMLARRLAKLAEEGTDEEDLPPLEEVCDVTLYLPDAERILFIAAHTSRQLGMLRGPRVDIFFAAIAEWSERFIPPEKFAEACKVALQISTQHEQMLAIPQPSKKGRPDSGN